MTNNISTEVEKIGFEVATGLRPAAVPGFSQNVIHLDIRPGKLWIARRVRGLASTGWVVEIMSRYFVLLL